MDQKTLARWLKAVIIGTGICGLVVFLWLVPFMGKGVLEGYPEFGSWYRLGSFFWRSTACPVSVFCIWAGELREISGRTVLFPWKMRAS